MITLKSITTQQVLVLIACMAVPALIYKFVGSAEGAGAAGIAGMVINFLMGREHPAAPAPKPGLTVIDGGKE